MPAPQYREYIPVKVNSLWVEAGLGAEASLELWGRGALASAPGLGAAVPPLWGAWVGAAQSWLQGQGTPGPCRVTLCPPHSLQRSHHKGSAVCRVRWEEEKKGSKGGRLEAGEGTVKW